MQFKIIDTKFPKCTCHQTDCPYFGTFTSRCLMYAKNGVSPVEVCEEFINTNEKAADP